MPRHWPSRSPSCSPQIRTSIICRASSKSRRPAAPRGAPILRSTTSASPPFAIARTVGYSVRVGGGLSTEPHLAVRLDAFVLPHQAVAGRRAITEIFRDQQGLRESRDRARMKYLFLKEGWTADSFLAELQSRLDFRAAARRAPSRGSRRRPPRSRRYSPQRQPGFSYVGSFSAARPPHRRAARGRRRTRRALSAAVRCAQRSRRT